MTKSVSQQQITMLTIVAGLLLTLGCGGNNPKSMIASANDNNVKRLATLYTFFHNKNRNRGPKDEAEFREFITQQDPTRLALADISIQNVDDLFVGERDGQPLVVRYGVNTVVRGPSLPVIFEKEGVDGRFQVGFTNGSMQEVDKTEYDQLLSGKADARRPDDSGRQVP